MKLVLYGHRGVGKSSLLERLQKQNPDIPHLDLDQEIANSESKSISQIFSEDGEEHFRSLESKIFLRLIQTNKNFVIAVGGGFRFEQIPTFELSGITKIWVRRATDSLGRIFLNRPRILPNLSSIEESLKLFADRNPRFTKFADWIYDMPEGNWIDLKLEQQIILLSQDSSELKGASEAYLTLMPEHLSYLPAISKLVLASNLQFEFRNDLLSEFQALEFCQCIPVNRRLMSLRRPFSWKVDSKEIDSDHQIEDKESCDIISFHQRPSGILANWLNQIASEFESKHHLKVAIPIDNFADLLTLWNWQRSAPEKRSVLPMDANGQWQWFRLLQKQKQKINFVRIGSGSAPDQPTIYEWANSTVNQKSWFAAVLGDPVTHSWSPTRHSEFFKQYNMPFLRISVTRDEFTEAFGILIQMGLRAAAVTSPLKELASLACQHKSDIAGTLNSVNTILVGDQKNIFGHNTDLDGVRKSLNHLNLQNLTVIWGGGGTLNVLKSCLQNFVHFSTTRTSENQIKDWFKKTNLKSINLVWAGSPNSNYPSVQLPVERILDLNYHSFSQAREYANVMTKSVYQDGSVLFDEQASCQQSYWKGKL